LSEAPLEVPAFYGKQAVGRAESAARVP